MSKLAWEVQKHRGEPPKAYVIEHGGLRVMVHRHLDYADHVWLVTSYGVIEKRALKSTDIEDAKREALCVIQSHLDSMLMAIAAIRLAVVPRYEPKQ